MGYFEHVKAKAQAQPKMSDTSPYMSMIERVEQRAYAMLEREELQTTDYACVDPFVELSPEDSDAWIELLSKAREMDKEFYARLYYIRGGGTRLVRDYRWGYVLQPIITGNNATGWLNYEQYEEEKHCLDGYVQQLISLLRMLAYDAEPIISVDARERVSGEPAGDGLQHADTEINGKRAFHNQGDGGHSCGRAYHHQQDAESDRKRAGIFCQQIREHRHCSWSVRE